MMVAVLITALEPLPRTAIEQPRFRVWAQRSADRARCALGGSHGVVE
jgi:hypothetical protein